VHCNLLCLVPSQYHILHDVEFHKMGGAVVQCYSPDLLHRLTIASRGIDYSICIIVWPAANEFFDVMARFKF
jgi:hypothetical protein